MRAREIFFGMQLVQDCLRQSGDDRFLRTDQIKDHHFIFALLKPWSGHIRSLGWADVPIAAEAVAVYPNDAFAPRTQIQKRVAGLFHANRAAPESRAGRRRFLKM